MVQAPNVIGESAAAPITDSLTSTLPLVARIRGALYGGDPLRSVQLAVRARAVRSRVRARAIGHAAFRYLSLPIQEGTELRQTTNHPGTDPPASRYERASVAESALPA